MDANMYTGYDDVAPKCPVAYEEYWNGQIHEWTTRNALKRSQAQACCEIMGMEFIMPTLLEIPTRKMVPVAKRKLRYQMKEIASDTQGATTCSGSLCCSRSSRQGSHFKDAREGQPCSSQEGFHK
eukprot:3888483-Amphidinium_carterae.2